MRYSKAMKTILVDAINGLVLEDGSIFEEMYNTLESYPNRKIVLTGANSEQFKKYNLASVPYAVFTLEHNPEKADPSYYKILLNKYNLATQDVIYFEHNKDAVMSARSVGIKTHFYDHIKRDLLSLKEFIDNNI